MIHAYFYSIPKYTIFYHKKKKYMKVADERAISSKAGKRFLFESHYGCFVDPLLENIVTERPLDRIPDGYVKL